MEVDGRFNGATSLMTWKTYVTISIGTVRCFNGATSLMTWKTIVRANRAAELSLIGFNGATSLMTWKTIVG